MIIVLQVLGGGVVGCSTAFALAQRGLSVTLVERASQVATGATSRSSACIRTHYSVEPNSVLANHAGQ
jgi:glycine/D-amino acid oxidase-like deaminating enzyme